MICKVQCQMKMWSLGPGQSLSVGLLSQPTADGQLPRIVSSMLGLAPYLNQQEEKTLLVCL